MMVSTAATTVALNSRPTRRGTQNPIVIQDVVNDGHNGATAKENS